MSMRNIALTLSGKKAVSARPRPSQMGVCEINEQMNRLCLSFFGPCKLLMSAHFANIVSKKDRVQILYAEMTHPYMEMLDKQKVIPSDQQHRFHVLFGTHILESFDTLEDACAAACVKYDRASNCVAWYVPCSNDGSYPSLNKWRQCDPHPSAAGMICFFGE